MVDDYVHKVREIIEEKDLIFGCKPVVYREKLICSHDPDQALFVDFREKKKKQTNTIMKMLSVVVKRTLPTERKKVFEKKRAVPPNSGLIKWNSFISNQSNGFAISQATSTTPTEITENATTFIIRFHGASTYTSPLSLNARFAIPLLSSLDGRDFWFCLILFTSLSNISTNSLSFML